MVVLFLSLPSPFLFSSLFRLFHSLFVFHFITLPLTSLIILIFLPLFQYSLRLSQISSLFLPFCLYFFMPFFITSFHLLFSLILLLLFFSTPFIRSPILFLRDIYIYFLLFHSYRYAVISFRYPLITSCLFPPVSLFLLPFPCSLTPSLLPSDKQVNLIISIVPLILTHSTFLPPLPLYLVCSFPSVLLPCFPNPDAILKMAL